MKTEFDVFRNGFDLYLDIFSRDFCCCFYVLCVRVFFFHRVYRKAELDIIRNGFNQSRRMT